MGDGVKIYVGAGSVVTPLGDSVESNFTSLLEGKTGVRLVPDVLPGHSIMASAFDRDFKDINFFHQLIQKTLTSTLNELNLSEAKGNWLVVFCTTKGNVDAGLFDKSEWASPLATERWIRDFLPFHSDSKTISLACVSGLAGVIYASDRITLGEYDHAIVVGADLVSRFTASGFMSFQALSDEVCLPFDSRRKGLNLGEGAAAVVLSSKKEIFHSETIRYMGGSTCNDANHISGPSRTGEGLYLSIKRTLEATQSNPSQIDFISAHGTATRYNDDMESIAFGRWGWENVPLHSLKGNYGHSLGASSLIELVMSIHSLKKDTILPTYGFQLPGTVEELNVSSIPRKEKLHTFLKTASGFGGVNASAIFTED